MFRRRDDGPRGTLEIKHYSMWSFLKLHQYIIISTYLAICSSLASPLSGSRPASRTRSNLLSLFALLADQVAVAALEDPAGGRHHLRWRESDVEHSGQKVDNVSHLIADWALKIFLKDRVAWNRRRGGSSHSIEPVKCVQLSFGNL